MDTSTEAPPVGEKKAQCGSEDETKELVTAEAGCQCMSVRMCGIKTLMGRDL